MLPVKTANPLVSVIMPLFNAEKHLDETLDSLLKQTFDNFEVVMVDDGSKDKTAAIALSYVKNDKRFRLIKQSNSGAAEARNRGMDAARADYLLFLDADDLFDSTLLEKLYQMSVLSGADICICDADAFCSVDARLVPSAGVVGDIGSGTYETKELSENLFQLFSAAPWNKLIRRQLVQSHGLKFQNLKKANDTFFIFAALAYSKTVSVIKEKLVHYRFGSGNSIRDNQDSFNECLFLAADKLHSLPMMKGSLNSSLNCWCLETYIYSFSDVARGSYSAAKQLFELYNTTYRKRWGMDSLVFPRKTRPALRFKWWCIKYLNFNQLYGLYHSQSSARYKTKAEKIWLSFCMLAHGLLSRFRRIVKR